MQVIAVAGRMGSGKDTAFQIAARDFGYVRMAFADAVRDEARPHILGADVNLPSDLPPELADLIRHQASINRQLASMFCGPVLYQRPYHPRIRKILQMWGTDYRRNLYGEDYWIREMDRKLRLISDVPGVFITDCRFPNEAQYVRSIGGEVWLVRRDEADAAPINHESEAHLDELDADVIIENNGDEGEFRQKVVAELMRVSGGVPCGV